MYQTTAKEEADKLHPRIPVTPDAQVTINRTGVIIRGPHIIMQGPTTKIKEYDRLWKNQGLNQRKNKARSTTHETRDQG